MVGNVHVIYKQNISIIFFKMILEYNLNLMYIQFLKPDKHIYLLKIIF